MNDEFIPDCETVSQIPQILVGTGNECGMTIQKEGCSLGQFQSLAQKYHDAGESLIGLDLEFGLFQDRCTARGHEMDFDLVAVVVSSICC